jgi:indole-3-glycerol phosphate synthase
MSVPTILEKILARKRAEVAELAQRRVRPITATERRSLASALRRGTGDPVRVLAEIKRASPSAGAIRPDADPVEIGKEYAEAGAAAISVLTDKDFFAGDIEFLAPVHDAVGVPCLRKDFLIDRLQIAESSMNGADAVLLIVAALEPKQLGDLITAARNEGMDALVEAHSLAEAETALAAGARLLGVNHRDLHTFAIDMTLTEQIAKRVPADVVLVAESGIKTKDDVKRLGDAGAHAVLIGETLMRAPSPGAALAELLA